MRIIGWIAFLNEKDYLEPSTLSLLPICDEIYLIEMATEYAPLKTEEGLSVDNSTEIAKNLASKYEKVKYISYGHSRDRTKLQDWVLQNLMKDGDWSFASAGDQIWYESSIVFRDFIEKNPDAMALYPQRIFSRKNWKDPCFNKSRMGYPWLHKYKEGMRYIDENNVIDKNNFALSSYPKSQIVFASDIGLPFEFFHMSRFCSIEKFFAKMLHHDMQTFFHKFYEDMSEEDMLKAFDGLVKREWLPRACKNKTKYEFQKEVKVPELLDNHPYRKYKDVWQIPREKVYEIPIIKDLISEYLKEK